MQQDTRDSERFWEGFYREREQVWSGEPNPVLVRETDGLTPGRALDLGCGEGADALWLAGCGWQVTAVDVSRTALERAEASARASGLAGRVDWQQHDLGTSFPPGSFDLVSACFLHSPAEQPGARDACCAGRRRRPSPPAAPCWSRARERPVVAAGARRALPRPGGRAAGAGPGPRRVGRRALRDLPRGAARAGRAAGQRLDNVLRLRRRELSELPLRLSLATRLVV